MAIRCRLLPAVVVICCAELFGCGGGDGGGGVVDINGGTPSGGNPPQFPSKLFISAGTGGPSTSLIASYASLSGPSGTLSGDRFISGAATSLNNPAGIALDAANDLLYVANSADNSILVFSPASYASGNQAPARRIAGTNTLLSNPLDVFLDAQHGLLYVANSTTPAFNGGVLVFASTADGNAAPARAITGFFGAGLVQGVFVDVANDVLYVSDFVLATIYSFDNASILSGSVTPTRTIGGSKTTLVAPRMIRVDGGDTMYVSTSASILVFNSASTRDGNVTPDRTIRTNNPVAFGPFGIFLDASDRLFIVNSSAQTLELIVGASLPNGTVGATATANLLLNGSPVGIAVNVN